MREGLVAEEQRYFALSEVETRRGWEDLSFDSPALRAGASVAQDEGLTMAVGR